MDGVPLDKLDGLYRGKGPGDVVTYVLERGGNRVEASVVLAGQPAGMLLNQVIQLSVGLAFSLVGILAWRLRRSDRVVRLAFVFSQIGAICLSTQYLSALRWPGLLLVAEAALVVVVPLTVHLYSVFPEEIGSWGSRILVTLAYALAGLLLVWTVVEHVAHGGLHISEALVVSRRAYGGIALVGAVGLLVYPPTSKFVRAQLFGNVHVGLGSGWSRPRRSRRILIAGMVVSLLPMLVLSYVPSWLFGAPLLDFPLTTPFFLLWPLSFGYALYTGYLGRVDPWVSRSLVWLLANSALLMVLAIAWATLDRSTLDPTGNELLRLGSVALILGVYSRALSKARRLVDWLLGSLPSYQGAVTRSSAELSEAHDVESLASRLMRIGQLLHFEAGLLLWRSGDRFVARRYYGYEDEAARNWWIPADGAIAQHLASNGEPRLLSDIKYALGMPATAEGGHEAEPAILQDERLSVWLPLANRAKLRGMLILGNQVEEQTLAPAARDILRTVGRQASIAAENVTLIEELRLYADQLREAEEEGRRSLARALHDGPLQPLDTIGRKLDEWGYSLSPSQVAEVWAVIRGAGTDLRTLCRTLRLPNEERGLAKMIEAHVDSFAQEHPELRVHQSLTQDGHRLPDKHRRELFAICKEAMQNTAKHANASSLLVDLDLDDRAAVLEVWDDGEGFSPSGGESSSDGEDLPLNGKHMGIVGMRERARGLGGHLEVLPGPEGGTRVRVEVPVLAGTSDQTRQAII